VIQIQRVCTRREKAFECLFELSVNVQVLINYGVGPGLRRISGERLGRQDKDGNVCSF
jgi:hypothetical protein